MPLVSVIMNVRNGAPTLREAIDSVLAQTFEDWELIAWDDRSTDESAVVVGQYRDARVRYFLSPEDVPLGRARRDAIRQAKGEWIAFLDQDDIWLPRKLEKQLTLVSDGVGLIYGRTIRFYPSGVERDYDQAHEYQLLPEGDIFAQLFTKSCFIAMSSSLFRRAAIEAIGGIPEEVRIIPDYYLYTAAARKFRVRAVQEVVCRYREHSGGASHTAAIAVHSEALWLMDKWAGQLDPQTLALCRRRHSTSIALEEIRNPGTLRQGVARLFAQGSVASQLVRPFAYVFHLVRRNLWRPYWRRFSNPSAR
jgi:glycosyltransferase involved in cell wall biosynthesis